MTSNNRSGVRSFQPASAHNASPPKVAAGRQSLYSAQVPLYEQNRKQHAQEMWPYFIAPMPVEAFLDKYAAGCDGVRTKFQPQDNPFVALEPNAYQPVEGEIKETIHLREFRKALATKLPNLTHRYHAHKEKSDQGAATHALSMDGGVYGPATEDPGVRDEAYFPEVIRQGIEVKIAPNLYLVTPSPAKLREVKNKPPPKERKKKAKAPESGKDVGPQSAFEMPASATSEYCALLPGTEAATSLQGQIATYLGEIATKQHRCHVYMLFLGRDGANLIRFERCGILVTDLIPYKTEGHLILEWVQAFDKMSLTEQGFDPTVTRLGKTSDEARVKLAKDKLKPFFPDLNVEDEKTRRSVYEVEVHSDKLSDKVRKVLIWQALFEASSTVGRGSKVYPCYDEETNKVYLLKDSWRDQNIQKEWEIVRKLNEKGVRHVPTLICGAELPGQVTTLQDFISADWRVKYGDVEPIRARCHQRQLFKEVGRPLSTVKSSKEMMYSTYHAFLGHQGAYMNCDVLHRDISYGNIIIVNWKLLSEVNNEPLAAHDPSQPDNPNKPAERGRDQRGEVKLQGDLAHIEGFLVDWDLARLVAEQALGQPRQLERTGTWHFMAARLCQDNSALQTVQDDMESFLHVVLYVALRYFEHSLSGPFHLSALVDHFTDLFDKCYFNPLGQPQGGKDKVSLIKEGLTRLRPSFTFHSGGVRYWIAVVLAMLKQWYEFLDQRVNPVDELPPMPLTPPVPKLSEDDLYLKDHNAIRHHWELVLLTNIKWPADKVWPAKETIADHLPKAHQPVTYPIVKSATTSSTGMSGTSLTSSKRGQEDLAPKESQAKRKRGAA